MKDIELEEFYNVRLNRILKIHSKMIMDDKNLSPIWKLNELNKIGKILDVVNEGKESSKKDENIR